MSFKPHRSNLKPVTRVELSDKHKTLRMILICLLLAVGVSAMAYGVYSLMHTEPGWQELEATCDGVNVSQDFILQYNYSGTAEERRLLTSTYSDAAEKAYWIFTSDQAAEGFANLYTINRSPNKPLTVDPALYDAFLMFQKYDSPYLYLGPVYTEYDSLFGSQNDSQADRINPRRNTEAADYMKKLLAFAVNPRHIRLELMGGNQITLHVSPEYLEFAKDYEIEDFLDFHDMKNAFVADYLASRLLEQGFHSGFIASYDGFTRNLGCKGESFSMNVFDYLDNTVYPAGIMSYEGPMSLVNLRSFPMMAEDRYHYYVYQDGETVTSFADPADGLYKSSTANLISYSPTESCAEILLQILPVYLSDSLNPEALSDLGDIRSLWCSDETIFYNDKNLVISDLLMTDDLLYQAKYAA